MSETELPDMKECLDTLKEEMKAFCWMLLTLHLMSGAHFTLYAYSIEMREKGDYLTYYERLFDTLERGVGLLLNGAHFALNEWCLLHTWRVVFTSYLMSGTQTHFTQIFTP